MHLEIKRICVPTDFSETAEHAFHHAVTLADALKAELHLLHVLENVHDVISHPDFTTHGDDVVQYLLRLEQEEVERSTDRQDEAAQQFLHKLEEGVGRQFDELPLGDLWSGLTTVRAVRHGHAVDQICRYASKTRIDLLVIGSHGRSGLKHFLMGSVAERVARAAPCPVLIVRKNQRDFVAYE